MPVEVNNTAAVSVRPGLPRWFDALAAACGLIVCSPLLLVAAVAVRFSSPGPILFRQQRMGLGGRPFTLYKFRSMRAASSGIGVTSRGDARITAIGRLLRATKLDESPELWNILRGDMSLVGPRPEVPGYVNLADPNWSVVLQVRPGLTDPVTLCLRNEEQLLQQAAMPVEEFYLSYLQPWKLRGYVSYLRKRSWYSDVHVLLDTFVTILLPSRTKSPHIDDILRGV